MHKAILNTLGCCLILAVLAVSYYLCYALQGIGTAAASVPNAAISIQQDVSAFTDALDRPCGSGHPCGTLAKINQTFNSLDSLIVHADLVARHEQQQLGQFDGYARNIVGDVHTLAAKGGRTLDSATQTANSATATLQTTQGTIAAAQPLLASLTRTSDASTATIQTFNGRLSDQRIDALLTSFRDMADNGNGIVADGRKVADYAKDQITRKKTFLERVEGYSGDVFDIAAYLARHYR